ncbi:unnamed protein product, partial [marine sediment metagenome]
KVGTWTILVGLFIHPEGSIAVAAYGGVLCVVAAELVPTFSNFAVASFSKV